MVLTAIEIIALVFISLGLLKVLVILVDPKIWFEKVAKPIYQRPKTLIVVSFVLALFVLYYLIQTLTIVQILAAMVFTALLMAMAFGAYSKEVLSLAQKMLKDKKIVKRNWLILLLWIALFVWAIKEIFF